jgi:hypothetical protein
MYSHTYKQIPGCQGPTLGATPRLGRQTGGGKVGPRYPGYQETEAKEGEGGNHVWIAGR